MSLPRDVMTRGLAFVRHLYTSAVQQSAQAGFRRATAVLTFHDAVEMLLVLGLQHHDIYNRNKTYSFDQYWTELATKNITVTQRATMQRLSGARANLKHHAGHVPPPAVEEARQHTRDFLIENTPIIFGPDVKFDDFRLSSLVTSSAPARKHLEDAEQHLMEVGQYATAIGEIAFAFRSLVAEHLSRRHQFRLHSSPDYLVLSEGEVKRATDVLLRAIHELQAAVRVLSLGLDFNRWARFLALTPRLIEHGGIEWRREATLDDCRVCYDFVIDSAIRLQEDETETVTP